MLRIQLNKAEQTAIERALQTIADQQLRNRYLKVHHRRFKQGKLSWASLVVILIE